MTTAGKQHDESTDTIGVFKRAWNNLLDVEKGRASYETIRRRFIDGSQLDSQHLIILAIAIIIASIGLNTNSTECVIGAMLICPLMGSALSLAYGVATLDKSVVRHAFVGLGIQIVICLAASSIYFALSPLSNETSELVANSTPTLWDVLVALAGGFAGGLGNTRKEEPATLIAGVAVATALMPPLCAAGYGIAMLDLGWFLMAFYEFVINIVFIAFACLIVLLLLRVPAHRKINEDGTITLTEERSAGKLEFKLFRQLVFLVLLFAIPCIVVSFWFVEKTQLENDYNNITSDGLSVSEIRLTTNELRIICPDFEKYEVTTDATGSSNGEVAKKVVATVTTSKEISDDDKNTARAIIDLHVENLETVNFETM